MTTERMRWDEVGLFEASVYNGFSVPHFTDELSVRLTDGDYPGEHAKLRSLRARHSAVASDMISFR